MRAGFTQKWSDLQDFCDESQSSQIGPHLVQPLSIEARAAALKIIAKRFNISTCPSTFRIIKWATRDFQAGPSRNCEVRRGKIGRCGGRQFL
jgi:hypothetical protein